MTAIREAFEETGLLLASPTMPESNGTRRLSDAVLDAMRASIHAEETFFDDFLNKYGLVADVEALHPFTEWITPLGPPRCVYSTRTTPTCVHRLDSVSSSPHTITADSTHGSTSHSCPPLHSIVDYQLPTPTCQGKK
jgi:8-oxo-dGTP pyrophosphatase MutT (NUDIX family)